MGLIIMKQEKIDSPRLKITLCKSLISSLPKQRKTAKSLGLTGKISGYCIRKNDDVTWGMINVIKHLVKVEGVN